VGGEAECSKAVRTQQLRTADPRLPTFDCRKSIKLLFGYLRTTQQNPQKAKKQKKSIKLTVRIKSGDFFKLIIIEIIIISNR